MCPRWAFGSSLTAINITLRSARSRVPNEPTSRPPTKTRRIPPSPRTTQLLASNHFVAGHGSTRDKTTAVVCDIARSDGQDAREIHNFGRRRLRSRNGLFRGTWARLAIRLHELWRSTTNGGNWASLRAPRSWGQRSLQEVAAL